MKIIRIEKGDKMISEMKINNVDKKLMHLLKIHITAPSGYYEITNLYRKYKKDFTKMGVCVVDGYDDIMFIWMHRDNERKEKNSTNDVISFIRDKIESQIYGVREW